MIIFLDESGDLGFDFESKRPSETFTITLLVCDNAVVVRRIERAVKRALKNKLNHKKSTRKVSELKGSATSISIKQYFARHLPNEGWCVCLVLH